MFPPGAVTVEQASEALRLCQGDLQQAKEALEAAAGKANKEVKPEGEVDVLQQYSDDPANQNNHKFMHKHNIDDNIMKTSNDKSNHNKTETNVEKDAEKQEEEKKEEEALQPQQERRPPSHSVSINNLSDRQYCCVWNIEEYKDGYRPDVARALLARVARHVNPILRERGWRVKRLLESTSSKFLGCCLTNGRGDADAASALIQLNLRVQPNKKCQQFRSFSQVLSVMLHEITHISIGLEDIHPPAFWELMEEIKQQYAEKLAAGEVDAETDDYGCKNTYMAQNGQVSTMEETSTTTEFANQQVGNTSVGGQEEWCGAGKQKKRFRGRRGGSGTKKRSSAKAMGIKANEQQQKRRPLKKGAKMIDKRTKAGKATVAALQSLTPRELAARAAIERFGEGVHSKGGASSDLVAGTSGTDESTKETSDKGKNAGLTSTVTKSGDSASVGSDDSVDVDANDDDDHSDDEIEVIEDHPAMCSCRCCEWDKIPAAKASKLPVLAQRPANFYD